MEKVFGKCGEKARAVAAGTIGVYTSAVGEAFESGQGIIDNVMAGVTTEAGDETGAAGVMVRMAPVGAHTGGLLPLAPNGWQVHVLL